jgi:hypothetical protein
MKMFLLFYIDHTSLFSPHEKEVYDNLIGVVGSEMDIRIRQNAFLIEDKIYNRVNTEITQVSSGSLAEGLDLPRSDVDIMIVFNNVNILQNVQHMNRSARHTTLLIEDDIEFPGFTTLKLIAEGDAFISPEYFVETTNGMYFSNISFIRKLIEISANLKHSAHGPCLSDKDEAMDIAYCFHFHSWPRQAEQWIYRHRPGQWPPEILIDNIVNYGCILVPIGPKEIENSELLWRISFSMAEKQLSHSMNYTQFFVTLFLSCL